jgi:hypothetical protein
MRPKLHLLPAILVVAFATQGCQDSPTALTGAGGTLAGAKKCDNPPCGGGGNEDPLLYSFTITGDISVVVDVGRGGATGGDAIVDNTSQIDFSPLFPNTVVLPGSDGCFAAGTTFVTSSNLAQAGSTTDEMEWRSSFTAKGTDGTTDINYFFVAKGGLSNGVWLPTAGSDATVDFDSWTIRKDTGKGKNLACEGSGSMNAQAVASLLP